MPCLGASNSSTHLWGLDFQHLVTNTAGRTAKDSDAMWWTVSARSMWGLWVLERSTAKLHWPLCCRHFPGQGPRVQKGIMDWQFASLGSQVWGGSAAVQRSSEKVGPGGPCGSKASGCYSVLWSLCFAPCWRSTGLGGSAEIYLQVPWQTFASAAALWRSARASQRPVGHPLRVWPVNPSGRPQSRFGRRVGWT